MAIYNLRILLNILFIAFVFCLSQVQTLAQDEPSTLEIEIKIVPDNSVEAKDRSVIITCFGSEPYSYMLYDKPPWKEGNLLVEGKDIFDNPIKIKRLTTGNYYLMVQDADKKIVAERIQVY